MRRISYACSDCDHAVKARAHSTLRLTVLAYRPLPPMRRSAGEATRWRAERSASASDT
jgi:hypothetical protein